MRSQASYINNESFKHFSLGQYVLRCSVCEWAREREPEEGGGRERERRVAGCGWPKGNNIKNTRPINYMNTHEKVTFGSFYIGF